MKRIKEFIKKNKGLSILLVLTLILLVIIFAIFFEFIRERNTNKYGSRLDGIDKVKITEKKLKEIKKVIKDNEKVEKVNLRIQGKIIYIQFTFSKGTELSSAKEIANKSLENFDEDELNYYDVSCFLIEKDDDNDETDEFKITGNKHNNLKEFTYINS